MAFSKPPCEPGDLVLLVKTVSDRPLSPRQSSVNRIEASNIRPSAVAAMQAALISVLIRFRRDPRARATFMSLAAPGMAPALVRLALISHLQLWPQPRAGDRPHDER